MPEIDESKRMAEERAEDLRERDRQREPRQRFRRLPRQLAGRDAFRVGLADNVTLTVDSPATTDGTIALVVDGDHVEVEAKTGDTAHAIATAIAEQINTAAPSSAPARAPRQTRKP